MVKKNINNKDIEQTARDLQIEMWENAGCPTETVDILNVFEPKNLIEYLGYNYQEHENLGEVCFNKNKFETAGMVDHDRKIVGISLSPSFKQAERNFTSAHEAGHIILHPHIKGLHRDRPIDSESEAIVDPIETQANKFATYWMMPKKLVLTELKKILGTIPITFDENLSWNLNMNNPNSLLRAEEKTLDREVALASYNGHNNFLSLAEIFGVSIKAMAIRLRELRVVRYP